MSAIFRLWIECLTFVESLLQKIMMMMIFLFILFYHSVGHYVKCPEAVLKSTIVKKKRKFWTAFLAKMSTTIESGHPDITERVWNFSCEKKSCKFFLMSAHLGTKNMIVLFLYDNVFMWQKRKVFNMFFVLPDAATIIVVNLYIRSFAKIDDVKMVRWKLRHKMLVELQKYFWM